MAYLSLYRKYRSQDFDSVVGQKHIVQTLKNAIENNRLAHAYLFSGPRGTGKTSMARILAKALNCQTGSTVKPCLKCPMCENIKNGTAVDVIEIDAASNRGIDEIRQLREQVSFVPVEGRYKVYIIDEVHMLTMEAFNALLKTLEEPPSHTLFVLATTEAQKIPATILSRCQRLDFKRITTPEIIQHLQSIAVQEQVTVDTKSLQYIARTADGCMRDAISLFDQLISYKGNSISFVDVLTVMGTSDLQALLLLIEKLLTRDVNTVLLYLDELILSGKNILQLNKDLLGSLRDLLLAKAGALQAIEAGADFIAKLQDLAKNISLETLKKMIVLFSKADTDMRWHSNSRLIFELAVMEFCLSAEPTESKSVIPVVEIKKTTNPEKEITSRTSAPAPSQPKAEQPPILTSTAVTGAVTLAEVKQSWFNVLSKVKLTKPALYILLCESEVLAIKDNIFTLQFKNNYAFHRDKLNQTANKESLELILKEVYGTEIKVQAVLESESAPEKIPAKSSAISDKPKQDVDKHTEQILSIFPGKVVKWNS